MNLSSLIKQYFASAGDGVTIDVFDEKNIYGVYQRVVNVLTQHIDIEYNGNDEHDERLHCPAADLHDRHGWCYLH